MSVVAGKVKTCREGINEVEKKNSYFKISLVDMAFRYEDSPNVMAENVTEGFIGMVEPVFPTNGVTEFNEVQNKRRKEWMLIFLRHLKKKITDLIRYYENN